MELVSPEWGCAEDEEAEEDEDIYTTVSPVVTLLKHNHKYYGLLRMRISSVIGQKRGVCVNKGPLNTLNWTPDDEHADFDIHSKYCKILYSYRQKGEQSCTTGLVEGPTNGTKQRL
eukprot:gb/GECG01000194.1/.p1 GENE.gb/GECG01000194.1/~~gb/GECG01000194.1/.p1  ORF type:complete len:116 (+),score=9.84 gb/GECG01000194.1/:1-348(+)